MKSHHTVSHQCASVDSANDLLHMLGHAHALCGLNRCLLVHQSEHCSVLHITTIADTTQLPHVMAVCSKQARTRKLFGNI